MDVIAPVLYVVELVHHVYQILIVITRTVEVGNVAGLDHRVQHPINVRAHLCTVEIHIVVV